MSGLILCSLSYIYIYIAQLFVSASVCFTFQLSVRYTITENQMTDGDQIWQDGSFYPGDGFTLFFIIFPIARMP